MKYQSSLYDPPFSDDTRKLRRNALTLSIICLFIGISGQMPSDIPILGIQLKDNSNLVGWFIFGIAIYTLLHFICAALIEFAQWMHPHISRDILDQEFRKITGNHVDAIDINSNLSEEDINSKLSPYSEIKAERKLRYFYRFFIPRLLFEAVLPSIVGILGVGFLLILLLN